MISSKIGNKSNTSFFHNNDIIIVHYSGRALLQHKWAGSDQSDTPALQDTDVKLCFTG